MADASTPASPSPVSPLIRWLVLILASIGFAFDIYELLMLPLIVRPALQELPSMGISPPTWIALLFYVPAVFGGIFGLLGGYLTDRLGRRRVLTWSILLYAVSAFLAGFSTNPAMLLVLRTTTFIGVCVEFVAAVAWLAELFPNYEERERALGYTQAFSSLGGILVAVAFGISVRLVRGGMLPPIVMPEFVQGLLGTIPNPHAPWRYTLMSGLIPAIPLIVIRPFLPESPVWQQKKMAGTLRRPSIAELFTAPDLRRVTIVTTIMFACSYGAAFGAIQHIPRIVPGLKNVEDEAREAVQASWAKVRQPVGTVGALGHGFPGVLVWLEVSPEDFHQVTPAGKIVLTRNGTPAPASFPEQKLIEQEAGEQYTKIQELGGLTGRFLLAFLAVRIVSRRRLLWSFQVPGLIAIPLVFFLFLAVENREFYTLSLGDLLGEYPITVVSLGVFLAGMFTVAQFSFWGNYLPRVYPLHLRGTGESFAANIGGRMIGTSFAAVTVLLSSIMIGDTPPQQLSYTAALVGGFVYLVGFLASFFLPEPATESMPEVAGSPATAKEGIIRKGNHSPLTEKT